MKDLNLLDPVRISRIVQVDIRRIIVQTCVAVVAIMIVGGSCLLLIHAHLQKKARVFEAELLNTRIVAPSGKDLPVAATTQRLNQRLAALKPMLGLQPLSQQVQDISNNLSAGIHLTGLSISESTKNILLKGFAATRSDIPLLQQAIEKIPFLSKVSIKSNINERANVQFELTATYVSTVTVPQ